MGLRAQVLGKYGKKCNKTGCHSDTVRCWTQRETPEEEVNTAGVVRNSSLGEGGTQHWSIANWTSLNLIRYLLRRVARLMVAVHGSVCTLHCLNLWVLTCAGPIFSHHKGQRIAFYLLGSFHEEHTFHLFYVIKVSSSLMHNGMD
jgi:hypothetical protein